MRFLFKLIFIPILFLIALFAFLPKEEFYNLLEKELAKRNIVVSNETRDEKIFGLKISDAEIFYDGLNVSFLSELDFDLHLFKNNINAKNIRISNAFNNFVPSKIDSFNISYSLLDFSKIFVNSKGEFGNLTGQIDLIDRKINAILIPSNIMKSKYRNILNNFKLVDGEYSYEQSF